MAIERMELMNLVAHQDHLDIILRKIATLENIHLIDAMTEIDESNFTLNMLEENMDEIAELCMIHPFKSDKSFKRIRQVLSELMEIMEIPSEIRAEHFSEFYTYQEVEKQINSIFKEISGVLSKKEALDQELRDLEQFRIVENLEGIALNFKSLYDMKHFTMKIGTLTKENRMKLTMNYENVSAIALHIGIFQSEEAYLIISPKSLELETERILRSVYFSESKILSEYLDMPELMTERIEDRKKEIADLLSQMNDSIKSKMQKNKAPIACCYSRTVMEEIVTKLKTKTACTNHFFYLSGWVGQSDKELVKTSIESVAENVIINFKAQEEGLMHLVPPTKLKNSKLLRPFELLVQLYGTPSYRELDPTVFLGLTYMLLFGAMFGDLGQGFVLMLAGLCFARRMPENVYGGILSRLGMSSMLFGILYDSVFGYEHMLSGMVHRVTGSASVAERFFIRPIENISTMLLASIILGVCLLFISFGYSIFNKLKVRDIQEGFFGRNGCAGLVLFISVLLIVLGKIEILWAELTGVWALVAFVMMFLIVLREPLTNYLTGRRPLYHEGASAYYVESGFDLLETFLSMLSNSVSFIRVGAFALNHVGLFIAFHTMAGLMGTLAGEVSMFIIGNLIIIFLEGLIVFIQGLRLVYYELFSKYYTGEGIPFAPASIRAKQ